MGRRKSFGNPLTKALGKAIDKVAPEVLDGFVDVATGPKKSAKKGPASSRSDTTDWHTRVPGTPRKHKH